MNLFWKRKWTRRTLWPSRFPYFCNVLLASRLNFSKGFQPFGIHTKTKLAYTVWTKQPHTHKESAGPLRPTSCEVSRIATRSSRILWIELLGCMYPMDSYGIVLKLIVAWMLGKRLMQHYSKCACRLPPRCPETSRKGSSQKLPTTQSKLWSATPKTLVVYHFPFRLPSGRDQSESENLPKPSKRFKSSTPRLVSCTTSM